LIEIEQEEQPIGSDESKFEEHLRVERERHPCGKAVLAEVRYLASERRSESVAVAAVASSSSSSWETM
jgi:hypothetical protein